MKKAVNLILRSKVTSFADFMNSIGESEEFRDVNNIVRYKLMKVKLNPRLGDKLDSGKVEFEVLNALEDLLMVW